MSAPLAAVPATKPEQITIQINDKPAQKPSASKEGCCDWLGRVLKAIFCCSCFCEKTKATKAPQSAAAKTARPIKGMGHRTLDRLAHNQPRAQAEPLRKVSRKPKLKPKSGVAASAPAVPPLFKELVQATMIPLNNLSPKELRELGCRDSQLNLKVEKVQS